jgi:hypothetical protein
LYLTYAAKHLLLLDDTHMLPSLMPNQLELPAT